eukprot:CAMPEP_0197052908 /NCGR_PEP_ID=MMETSP1384-20130603/27302_1 /TAXON_ID=29189 /ORGANISM="Ammonia sp." /LENGTH=100 /DNA_ID=CAMNT_0042485729 /DNA_START=169 /DNA_END=468 /DNA_ORIENTATION=-
MVVFIVCETLAVYLCFYLIKKYIAAPAQDTILAWRIRAIKNTFNDDNYEDEIYTKRKMKSRKMNKYDLQIISLFGGTLGLIIQFAEPHWLQFLTETCHVA